MIFDLAEALWQVDSLRASTETLEFLNDDVETIIEVPTKVVLFNDNFHTFDEVIFQVCKAINCTEEHAEKIAWEVHTQGKSLVFDGNISECLNVSSILEEIGLHTQIIT
ncbi:MAG: ATP-dependent Clp protease adaptor ClpS [Bacteroidota bacterium]|nr:ATP-dependent Clp protease adaptor ClpS [Bacteroidota bacterium]MDP4236011.1 ATP-dependent Clp protease adaptor ClpS [Bacteroidota bacterium]